MMESLVYYRWQIITSVAVVYNLIVVVARSIFWKLHEHYMFHWLVTDYIADVIYVIDIAVNMRTGTIYNYYKRSLTASAGINVV